MANRLFDAPDDLVKVVYGDGQWSAIPFDIQASAAATTLLVQDPCTEQSVYVAGAHDTSSPLVYKVSAFAASVSARRHNRCAMGEELEMVTELLQDGGQVSAAEYVLWNGMPGWDPNLAPSLQNNDVKTLASGTSIADTIGLLISRYSALTVLPAYIVHLGVDAAVDLSALGYTETIDADGQLRLRATGAPIVVSPYYPAMGIAITGPILVHIGEQINAFQTYSAYDNRTNVRGDQLEAVAFDPSTAVRAV